jgi:UDP-N-acetyl-D-mannosaminuronic acid dehydrogenase/UDP-N-acetyl-D-glucosamine dehydrogenase
MADLDLSHDDTARRDTLLMSLLARLDDRTARVAVLGQGYVGLPVAIRASEVGFPVVGFDTSVARVASLRAGDSYVEDISTDALSSAIGRGYLPTADPADLAGFDVAVVSVPTPLREGLPDISFIADAARMLADVLRPGAVVILESTTYPGTTEEVLVPLLESAGLTAGVDLFVGYSPERIDPGNSRWNLVNTPKVVSGVDAASTTAVDRFFCALVERTVPVGSCAEAELVKLLENTFRHVNIALVNELAMFARELGVDVWRAIDAASTKPFGYMRFTPGPGVGGHCLPIDPSYLSWRVRRKTGRSFRFVELANDVNEHMPDYVVDRVTSLLNQQQRSVNGSRVLCLGLAYKANTSDARESPSRHVIALLQALGADVKVCDPHIPTINAGDLIDHMVEFSVEELAAADVAIILVDHAEFDPEFIGRHAMAVLDTKGITQGHSFGGERL